MPSASSFRELLRKPGIIHSLAAHDVFSAVVMEQSGIDLVFAGGFGVSASLLGQPDVGLLTLTEMAEVVRRMASRLSIPVVADGDTGFGDLQNVARTVQEFERAGAAGLLLEDQVSPKRCGHFAGKDVIRVGAMLEKLQVALITRSDPNFAIFARTDALAVEGIEAAIERANRYAAIGADVCFVEGPTSTEDLKRIAKEVNAPQLANMLSGGVTPIVSFEELEQMGYQIGVCPIAGLLATGRAIQQVTGELLKQGRVDGLAGQMMSFDEIKQLLGLQDLLSLRERLES